MENSATSSNASAHATDPAGAPRLPRILQVNSRFSGGGTDNQTLELTAGLHELGVPAILAIPAGSQMEPVARQAGLDVLPLPGLGRLKLGMIRFLAQYIRRHGVRIVHAHQGRDYWPVVLAARLAGGGVQAVITRHLMTRPRTVSRWLLLRASRVIAVSRAVEEVLRRELHGPAARLSLIYGGIDIKAFSAARTAAAAAMRKQWNWGEQDVVFAVVGGYQAPRGKGQLEFLEAAGRVRAEFPRARFAVVGRGSMESELRERIQVLDLGGVAAMVPFTSDVATVMSAIDVLAHPAVGTEALGLVLWEAMACAKPVIASRLDGIPEAFEEGRHGYLVPPGDVVPLAGAMAALLADPALRERLGRAGRVHVEQHFTRAHLARATQQLYLRALMSKPRAEAAT